ncbi:protein CUSTOS isoform X2 [Lemur catta]|uniref:protein CUSTOS isoform X2 n=1 Tax=Lemur catta TaxID=9447 RepID=UPI001E26A7FB|nr:protein CUSTOS isoform X2 [Lemur catta]
MAPRAIRKTAAAVAAAMRRSWLGVARRRCRPGAWSSARGGRRNQEPVLQITSCQPPTRASGIRWMSTNRMVTSFRPPLNSEPTWPRNWEPCWTECHPKSAISSPLSVITISEVVKEPRKAEVQKVTSEDDGFRLFFTSIPGGPEKEASPKPRRKRQPSSSSEDSDEEWRRCREAAVSASDILQESALHGPVGAEKEAGKKRKSKKKAKKAAGVDPAVATSTSTASGATGRKQEKEPGELSGDHVSLGTKKKKRKKKARKAGEPSPLPPAKSAAAEPAN